MKLYGLDLFTGIGGITYALQQYVHPFAYCEIEPYCQSILLQNMQKGYLPKAPIWDDIRTLSLEKDSVDIIYGGFPCQDISIAGLGKGLEGQRSGLFSEIMRLSKEIKPKFIFLENVPAITTRGGLQVVKEITQMGYDCRWCIISAASIGALHRRERWFLLANSTSSISSGLPCGKTETYPKSGICDQYRSIDEWREAVSSICRTSDGVPNRVDRIKALGNSVVPQQAKKAFEILIGIRS